MRIMLLPAWAFALFAFASCNTSADNKVAAPSTSSQAQKNIDADKIISEAFESGDAGKLDGVVASDFVDHTDMGDKKGIDSLKSGLNMIHSQFKDMKMELKRQWADDEYVVDWTRYTGTNPTAMMGMPAGPFDIKGMEVTRFMNGKAVEHWFFDDSQMVADWMKGMQGMGTGTKDKMDKKSK
jgi:predicted ester cyclase